MAKTHRAPNSTIHCTGSTKNDRKTWQNRTRNPEDGFESCSVHHKKFWNQTILELFLLLFALKSSWFTGGKKCNCNVISLGEFRKRQTTPRMDRHETIVTGRCETFRYCHIGGKGMTSAELKHRVKLQEWAARIQDCRSSGLSVRAWCRQEEINAATYYRWERELLALAETEPCSSVSAVRFAELPAPKRVPRNVAERSATLHIGNASLDIYPGCDTEQLKMLVELLRLC